MIIVLRQPVNGEILIAWQKYIARSSDEITLKEGDVVELLDNEDPVSAKKPKLDPELDQVSGNLLDNSAARHKLSVRPRRTHTSSRHSPTRLNLEARWLVREVSGGKKQGWVPCKVLQSLDDPTPGGPGLPGDAMFRRQAVVKELVETEQEFVKDLDHVVQKYLLLSETKNVPKVIRDNFEVIFGNLKEIAEFHRTVLMEGVKYYANEPHFLGKFFLRLERDFDKHVDYYMYEPQAQAFLDGCDEAHDYFDELSQRLSDDKTISEHLKLPIQRINDYQLLLKELVRYSACLGEDNSDLQKALELMLSVPHRAQDEKFTSNIEGYRGSIHKLGRLLAHDWFSVTLADLTKERYLFLFKGKVLICKVRRISEDRSVFQLKDIIQLNRVAVKDHPEEERLFELIEISSGKSLNLAAHRDHITEYWLKEIKEFAKEYEEGEDTEDDFQLASSSPPTDTTQTKEDTSATLQEVKVRIVEAKTVSEEAQVVRVEEAKVCTKVEVKEDTKSAQVVQTSKQLIEELKGKVQDILTESRRSSKVEVTVEDYDLKKEATPVKLSEDRTVKEQHRKVEINEINESSKVVDPVETVEKKEQRQATTEESQKSAVESKVKEQLQEKPVVQEVRKAGESEKPKVVEVKVQEQSQEKAVLPEVKKTEEPQNPKVVEAKVEARPQEKSVVPDVKKPEDQQKSKVVESKVEERVQEKPIVAEVKKAEESQKSKVAEIKVEEPKKQSQEKAVVPEVKKTEESQKPTVAEIKVKEHSQEKPVEVKKSEELQEAKVAEIKVTEQRQEKPAVPEVKKAEDSQKAKVAEIKVKEQPQETPVVPEVKKAEDSQKAKVAEIKVKEQPQEKPEVPEVKKAEEPKVDEKPKQLVVSNHREHEPADVLKPPKEPSPVDNSTVDSSHLPDSSVGLEVNVSTADDMSRKYTSSSARAEGYSESSYSRRSGSSFSNDGISSRYGSESIGSRYGSAESSLGGSKYDSLSSKYDTGDASSYSRRSLRGEGDDYSYSRHANLGDNDNEYNFSKRAVKTVTTEYGDGDSYSRRSIRATAEAVGDSDSYAVRRSLRGSVEGIGGYGDSEIDSYSVSRRSIKGRDSKSSQRSTTSIEEIGDASKYTRKTLAIKDDVEEDLMSKYSPSKYLGEDREAEDVYAKFERKYSRTDSSDSKTKYVRSSSIEQKAPEEDVYAKYTRKYSRTDSSKSKEEEEEKPRKYSRSDSNEKKSYKRTDSVKSDRESSSIKSVSETTVANGKEIRKEALESSESISTSKTLVKETSKSGSKHLEKVQTSGDEERNRFVKTIRGADIELTTEEKLHRAETDKPEFVVKLKDTELAEHTYLRFMVKVRGEPMPEVVFFKNGIIIEKSDRYEVIREHADRGFYELLVPEVKMTDAGTYKCVASNKWGEESSEAILKVTTEDLHKDMPEGEILPAGEAPEFHWKKDGNSFEPDERFKVLMGDDEDSLALFFQHVKAEDVGLYTCVAQTSRGHISCSAELTVHGTVNQLVREPEKPQLIVEKREPIVAVGGSAMLELQVKGFPKPQVKWTHEGKPIEPGGRYKVLYEDEETMSLVIKDVKKEDAGKYQCIAENEIGRDTAEMTLTVKTPPKLKSKIEDIDADADLTLRIPVEVEGTPKPTVVFYKDGKEIKKDDRITIVEEGDKTILVIEKTCLKDSGSYSVVATNEMAQINQFFNMNIHTKPKILEKLGKDKIVSQGESVILKIKIEAEPAAEVRWFKDDQEIKSSDHYEIKKDGDTYIMKITGAVTTDAAKYKVKAVNFHGSAEDELKIDVKKAPKITKGLENMTVTEHDSNVTFDVRVEAFPKPTVKWYLDEMEITETKTEFTRIESDDGVKLVIKEVNSQLSGKYTCKFSNECGNAETSAKLTVNCAPRIIKQLKDTTVEEGATLQLEVEVESVPEPTVKWLRNGREVSADARIKISRDTQRQENYHLAVNLIKYEEEGEYEVVVTNSLGTVSSKSYVTVHTKPTISDHTMKDASRPESLGISYMVKGTSHPPPTATWTLNGKELKPEGRIRISQAGEEFKLEILRLEMADAGTIQCTISNPLGSAKQQAVLEVTPERELRRPKLKQGLEDQTIVKKNSVTFKVVVIGDPVPVATWSIDGAEITPEDYEKHKIILESEDHEIQDGLKECTYSLTIPRCERSNSGKYTFSGKNKWGECDSSAQLTIVLRPEIEGLENVSVVPGEAAVFVCRVQSNPLAEVKWTKDDQLVKATENIEIVSDAANETYRIIFKSVQMSDDGYYKVIAKNSLGETTSEARLKTLTDKPNIITGLSDEQVHHTKDISVMVRADGLPKPTIRWYLNDKPLSEDANHKIEGHTEAQVTSTLTVTNFQEADSGTYKAVATNVAGDAETVARITMLQTAPSFGKKLERSEDVNEGEPLELKAKVNGSPIPTVAWFKNGEPINDERVKTTVLPDGTVKLNIDKAEPGDCGAYKLVIKNPNGESSCLCAVAVAQKPQRPKFLKVFKDVQLPIGETLRLEAMVQSHPPPEIKWFKDGVPVRMSSNVHQEIHPDGKIALIVDCAKPENAGKYELLVSNKYGDATSEGAVDVSKKPTKPEFLTRLVPQTVVEGFPVKFEVKVNGFPAPKISWSRNGVEVIPDNKHVKIQNLPDGTSVLLLDSANQARDALTYRAIAINEAGEAETSSPLTVLPGTDSEHPEEKPMFLHPLKDVIGDEGKSLILSAPFTANPIPSVQWTKDGVPLTPSDKILVICDGKKVGLEILNAVPSDCGQYGVTLINPLGEESSAAKAIVKKVFMPPHFTQTFTDLQQLPGRDAKFPCRVSGVPQPEVTWSKDGAPIKESDKYHIKRDGDLCCLYVLTCDPKDAGVYRAKATNKEGEEVCTAALEVVDQIKAQKKIEPPAFLKRIGDTELFKGMTAKFTACATGYPEPEVEWYHNDQKLFPSNRIRMETDHAGLLRLTISNLDEDDLGKYSCKITNEYGGDICHANLNMDEGLEPRVKRPITDQYTEFDKYKRSGAPMPLSDPPIISQMTDRHCTLSWRPSIPSGPRAPVTYQLEMCELPNGDWFTVRTGIRSCTCGVRNLEPFRDYRFRVRVENKYGISDPSPYATTHRSKLEPELPKFRPYLPPEIDFRPETSPYFPKDFDIERPPHDNMAQAPRFLRQEHDTQYGVKDQNSNLFWFVYGYPKPNVSFYFNDEPVESGGRFDMSYTRNGQATLFINKMLERDVGWYEAVARNEHGEARQRVRLEIAEAPTFLQRPEIQYAMHRGKGRFEARIVGVPYPDIKWYKDWKPLATSSRIKIQFIEPDTAILLINDIISKDEALYSVSARNVAGSISSSAMLYVEESDLDYNLHTYRPISNIKPKKKPMADFYDLGDELGRGTQGITYHAAERVNGRNWAAKIMHGRGELRPFMYNELEVLNNLRHRKLISLHDSYEAPDTLALILELAGGGELVKDHLLRHDYYTEREIAGFMRQLLQGLEYMHQRGYGHMGLNLGDLLLAHPGGDDLKITDFGLSRRIQRESLAPLLYGVPEYASPEAVNGEGTGLGQDMWSVGIITYILLSGRSPFRGNDDRETLKNVQAGKWTFDEDWWLHISSEAKDFISKLLVFDAEGRMDVHAALRHPWLERADKKYTDEYRISSKYLEGYYKLFREWYDNASCKKWFRRRTLESAFTHPSRMVYPPGEYEHSPRVTPSPIKAPRLPTWEDQLPARSPLNYEIGAFKSESHYQQGPDTYLLQLRDVDFPVRLREYMKVAGSRGPGGGWIMSHENGYDWTTPTIRERRRFTDIMDEEIDDERKTRINKYGTNDTSYSIRRLKHELGSRLDTYVEAEAYIESKQEGHLPFFREKPQMVAMVEGSNAELTCFAVGEPQPVVQWFKNDGIIAESHRVKIETDDQGRSHLRFLPALSFDQGMYKVVARNKIGQKIARARIVLGSTPDEPDSPEAAQISANEIFLTWKQPKFDGNSPVLCYSLEYKLADDVDWKLKADNIDHEFYLLKDLAPNTNYMFRLAARNAIGWGDFGVPTGSVQTKGEGAEKIHLSPAVSHLQQITDSGQPIEVEAVTYPDYATEQKPVEWDSADAQENYHFISEISRGRFSTVLKAIDKRTDAVVVAKVLDLSKPEDVDGEFAALRSLRHERVAGLVAAFKSSSPVAVFVLEKLQGSDVLTYLASKHEYTEQTVATIVSQVLDGLQYLHWRGLCHLDLQPDNVVLAGVRSVQAKLVDLGSAHRVTKLGTKVPVVGHADYISPEVLNDEPAFPQTDIWTVGVLTYVMLSGVVPFKGQDLNETKQNISFVRYRFEHLYNEISQESTRFLMLLFKRQPNKRPSAEECHENRWLLPTDYMIKKRERAVFLGNRLRAYSTEYHNERAEQAQDITTKLGGKFSRSQSIQEELLTAP